MRENYLEDFYSFLRFPSVSTDEKFSGKVKDCAQWLSQKLTRVGLESKVVPTAGHPVVWARNKHRAGRPTAKGRRFASECRSCDRGRGRSWQSTPRKISKRQSGRFKMRGRFGFRHRNDRAAYADLKLRTARSCRTGSQSHWPENGFAFGNFRRRSGQSGGSARQIARQLFLVRQGSALSNGFGRVRPPKSTVSAVVIRDLERKRFCRVTRWRS